MKRRVHWITVQSENYVLICSNGLRQNCPTITHRLSSIKSSDTIVVMHDGCLVEQGTHDKLLAQENVMQPCISGKEINIVF